LLKALSDIGAKEIPIILADEWTEEQRAQFLIKDNVGFGEWDWNTLANEWDADKLTEWGLDLPPMDAIELEAEEDDYKMPEQIETDIVLGDLFEIGEHRLLCGDSTDSDAVAKLMNGEKAELLFTSPPYSDMREYNGEKDLSVSNLIEFIPTFMPYANFQVINLGLQRKDNEIVQYWNEYIEMAKSCGYKFLSWNVWNREGAGFSMAQITAMFAIQHEWIFVFGNNRKELNLTVPNKDAGEFNDHSSNRQKDGTVKKGKNMTIRSHRQLGTVNSIINEQSREWTKFHPAVFPIALPEEYIKAMTNEGHIVAESFTGSGTTMVASHQLKRKCYGMELDPKYCQVIVDRMIKLDPTLQIKRNGQTYNRQTTDGE
jgi:DNA modification methylase